MVNAEILYEDDEKIKILLKETDRAFVNSIRRTLMSDTPKMAIETVSFIKKTEEEDGEGEGRRRQLRPGWGGGPWTNTVFEILK